MGDRKVNIPHIDDVLKDPGPHLHTICKGGTHDFIEVYNDDSPYSPIGEGVSIKWCRFCGGVVGDQTFDGRVHSPGSLFPMQFPELARQFIWKPSQNDNSRLLTESTEQATKPQQSSS